VKNLLPAFADVFGGGLFERPDYAKHREAARPARFYTLVWRDVGLRLQDSIQRVGAQIEQEQAARREN
jgi:hypothetical protein